MMTNEQILSLVSHTIPLANQITHVEFCKTANKNDTVRFTWKKIRFQISYISDKIYADEQIDGVFLGGTNAILLQQLLRLSRSRVKENTE